MYLSVFALFLALSFVLIVLGIAKQTDTIHAVLGFVFLFFLALVLLQGNLEVQSGTQTNMTYAYSADGNLTLTEQTEVYTYKKLDNDDTHNFGFWLGILAFLGFTYLMWQTSFGVKKDK